MRLLHVARDESRVRYFFCNGSETVAAAHVVRLIVEARIVRVDIVRVVRIVPIVHVDTIIRRSSDGRHIVSSLEPEGYGFRSVDRFRFLPIKSVSAEDHNAGYGDRGGRQGIIKEAQAVILHADLHRMDPLTPVSEGAAKDASAS